MKGTMKEKYFQAVACIFLVVGLVTAVALDFYRVKAEEANKTVEILVDYDEVRTLAAACNLPLAEVATAFRTAGATGVVVKERTIHNLAENGGWVVLRGGELALQQSLNAQFLAGFVPEEKKTYLLFRDERVPGVSGVSGVPGVVETSTTAGDAGGAYGQIVRSADGSGSMADEVFRLLQAEKTEVSMERLGDWRVITLPILTVQEEEKLGVGFPRQDLQQLNDAGLTVVPRIRSWGQANEKSVAVLIESLRKIPGLALLTFNDEVLPGNSAFLTEQFRDGALTVPVGLFEFYPQQGLNQLAIFMQKEAVRVHCIGEDEMKKINEKMALDRYRLAVSERNIRVLYVRLFGMQQPKVAFDSGVSFIGKVKANVQAKGFTVGTAQQLPSLPYSRLLVLAVGLGVIGGVLLLLRGVLSLKATAVWGLIALIGWVGLLSIEPLLARKVFALIAAIVFPTFGVLSFIRREQRTAAQTVWAFLRMTGLSFLGAVLLTGLLADKAFMLKLDQFSGVKLAHLAPLLLIPGYLFWQEFAPNLLGTCRKVLTSPLLVWQVLVGGLVLVALAVYLMRTGNDASVLVSSLEMRLRDFLDQLLSVRPRTKEFLLGHPAMLLLLFYGFKWPRLPLLLLGVIGQISLVNTYAHLHTPLLISLERSFHGLWLGLFLGISAILALGVMTGWLARRQAANG